MHVVVHRDAPGLSNLGRAAARGSAAPPANLPRALSTLNQPPSCSAFFVTHPCTLCNAPPANQRLAMTTVTLNRAAKAMSVAVLLLAALLSGSALGQNSASVSGGGGSSADASSGGGWTFGWSSASCKHR